MVDQTAPGPSILAKGHYRLDLWFSGSRIPSFFGKNNDTSDLEVAFSSWKAGIVQNLKNVVPAPVI